METRPSPVPSRPSDGHRCDVASAVLAPYALGAPPGERIPASFSEALRPPQGIFISCHRYNLGKRGI